MWVDTWDSGRLYSEHKGNRVNGTSALAREHVARSPVYLIYLNNDNDCRDIELDVVNVRTWYSFK